MFDFVMKVLAIIGVSIPILWTVVNTILQKLLYRRIITMYSNISKSNVGAHKRRVSIVMVGTLYISR